MFGATGFVGRLLARYLARTAPSGLRVGLAGRNIEALQSVRAGLQGDATAWPLLEADSRDAASLTALARSARVVVTTAGPYRRHGMGLVAACCAEQSDYADLTGEVLFMRESAERFHHAAAEAGVRIVHACGFDSIPSDLAALLLHETARSRGAGTLCHTTCVVTSLRGSLSGGTFSSMKGQLDEMKREPGLRRVVGDPYALSPDRDHEPSLGREADLDWVQHDAELGLWVGPFVMARANTRVVRRSNALQEWAYGREFRYREVMGFGTGPVAPLRSAAASVVLGGLVAGLSIAPSRAVLDRLLPKPGQGPSETTQRNGRFRFEVHTTTSTGARLVATAAARGDPGYAATSVMLGESALSLVVDRDRLPGGGGVLTPATALGDVLVQRLRAAGHTYSVAGDAAARR